MPSLTLVVLGLALAVAVVAGLAMIITRRARFLGGEEVRGRKAVIVGLIVLACASWIGWIMTLAARSPR